MKRSYISVVALFALVILGVSAQPNGEPVPDDLATLLEPMALQEFLADPPDGFFLVDTRTPQEYVDGHIPTAIQIDYRDIGSSPPTDDKDALIILYCRSGNRSNVAAQTLASLGYTQVLDWGGIIDWPFEIVSGSNPE